ncbi:MAG: hypothetical protein HC785_04720 [Calothrix sp. CSU_2_0]|nr:hypothetical protein [Calothrix sp. CSU_2_0]
MEELTYKLKQGMPLFLHCDWKLTLIAIFVLAAAPAKAAETKSDRYIREVNLTTSDTPVDMEMQTNLKKDRLVLIPLSPEQKNLVRRLKQDKLNSENLNAIASIIRNPQQSGLKPKTTLINRLRTIRDSRDLHESKFGLGEIQEKHSSNSHLPNLSLSGSNLANINILSKQNRNKADLTPIKLADNPPTNTKTKEQDISAQEVEKVLNDLRALKRKEIQPFFSPSLSIYIPTGYGSDRNRGFIGTSYQERGRFSDDDDLGLGFGVGLGDAYKSVGVEVSYTLASLGRNRDFGSGGFNLKVHRQLPGDLAVAVGWNGFLNIGESNNFEQSLYGVATKIFKTRENIDSPFSRVALTAGIGTGQFRTEDAVFAGDYNVNVFGNVAVRIAKPASLIVEWSGQDLGVGLSINPFPDLPIVITPAIRDITGAGDGSRFVFGAGFSFQL